MNDKIYELAKQADLIEFDSIPGSKAMTPSYESIVKARKFAELIVRECAELIDNKVTITAAQTYDEVFVAVYDTNFANAKKIKEHFGVEE